jgi:HPt (histidine-containing phosphotransfer) domain-containing protein
MTAYALQGDSQRCLDAGMDDYISKPLDTRRVMQVMQRWAIKRPEAERSSVLIENTPESSLLLDTKSALPRFSNDIEFYISLLDEFIASIPERLEEQRTYLKDRQWKKLADSAHNLKGVAANFGAMRISAFARELDDFALAEQEQMVEDRINKIAATQAEIIEARNILMESK